MRSEISEKILKEEIVEKKRQMEGVECTDADVDALVKVLAGGPEGL